MPPTTRRKPTARRTPRASRPSRSSTERRVAKGAEASGLAPGMQAVNAYLAVANVAATMTFLESAFGFERGVVLPDGGDQLRYAEMRHGGSVIVLVRRSDPATPTGGAAGLYTYVDDVDGALAQARKAGAGVSDAEDKPWGDRVAVVTDPDGYRWILATFKKLVPFS